MWQTTLVCSWCSTAESTARFAPLVGCGAPFSWVSVGRTLAQHQRCWQVGRSPQHTVELVEATAQQGRCPRCAAACTRSGMSCRWQLSQWVGPVVTSTLWSSRRCPSGNGQPVAPSAEAMHPWNALRVWRTRPGLIASWSLLYPAKCNHIEIRCTPQCFNFWYNE